MLTRLAASPPHRQTWHQCSPGSHGLTSRFLSWQVLKDSSKPKAKGNFWVVHRDRIPPEALKLQSTPVSRQEEAGFAQDLSPYVLHGWPYEASCRVVPQAPRTAPPLSASTATETTKPPLGSSFAIEALLPHLERADSRPEPERPVPIPAPSLCAALGSPVAPKASPPLGERRELGPPMPASLPLHACCSSCSYSAAICQPAMPWGQLPPTYCSDIVPAGVACLPQAMHLHLPPALPCCTYGLPACPACWSPGAVPCFPVSFPGRPWGT